MLSDFWYARNVHTFFFFFFIVETVCTVCYLSEYCALQCHTLSLNKSVGEVPSCTLLVCCMVWQCTKLLSILLLFLRGGFGAGGGTFICSFLELMKYNEIIVTIIIKVLIKCKIMSIKPILKCAHAHTHTLVIIWVIKKYLQHSETPSGRAPW